VREPEPAAAAALGALDVRGVRVSNAHCPAGATERRGDGHGNKAWAVSVPTGRPRVVLLDSDVLCLRPPPFVDAPSAAPFRAKPVDMPGPIPWPAVYDVFGLPVPEATMRPTRGGPAGPPYFNSGVVALDGAIVPGLGACWRDSFAQITARGVMEGGIGFFRDQVSLAVAVQRLGLAWEALDEDANWPAHLRPVEPGMPPALAHYHGPDVVAATPALRDAVQRLVRRYPAVHAVLAARPAWAPVLD